MGSICMLPIYVARLLPTGRLAQIRLDKPGQFSIQHGLRVAGFKVGAVVFDLSLIHI
jgi:hypothetical protein